MTEERRIKVIENARKWKRATNYNEKRRESKRARRLEILKHYSNGNPKCICCGETHFEFLALDHIEGNGNEHRRKVWGRNRGGGNETVEWILKNNYPPIFQVLCHNCNSAKGFYGKCPHET